MTPEAIVAVSAAVTMLVQLAKWGGVPKCYAPLMVLVCSLVTVALWGYSQGEFSRTSLFTYFVTALTVTMSAVGIYGFTTREQEPTPPRARRVIEAPPTRPLNPPRE